MIEVAGTYIVLAFVKTCATTC